MRTLDITINRIAWAFPIPRAGPSPGCSVQMPGIFVPHFGQAPVSCQMVLVDDISGAFHEQRLALGAAGVLVFPQAAWQVAGIHEFQARFLTDLSRPLQGLHRGWMGFSHFVIGMESGHMPGDIG